VSVLEIRAASFFLAVIHLPCLPHTISPSGSWLSIHPPLPGKATDTASPPHQENPQEFAKGKSDGVALRSASPEVPWLLESQCKQEPRPFPGSPRACTEPACSVSSPPGRSMTQEGYHCSLIAGVISGCGGDELVSAFSMVECPQLQPDTWCSHELDLQVADRWRALSLIIGSQQSLGDALDNDHPHRAEEETMEEVALPCCSWCAAVPGSRGNGFVPAVSSNPRTTLVFGGDELGRARRQTWKEELSPVCPQVTSLHCDTAVPPTPLSSCPPSVWWCRPEHTRHRRQNGGRE
jgi:hypothetical protein